MTETAIKRMWLLTVILTALMMFFSVKVYADDVEETPEKIILNAENTVVTLAKTEYTYYGGGYIPGVTVKYINPDTGESVLLTKGEDYYVRYPDNVNVGRKTVIITAKNKYSGTLQANYRILPKSIEKAKVNYQLDNPYRKKYIKPLKSVKLGDKTLVNGVDYKVSYKNNWYPGTGKIIITGIGNYKGTKVEQFYIAKVKNFKLTSRGSQSLTFSWYRRDNVTGYKIYRYEGSKRKIVKTVKGSASTRCTISNLSGATNYKFAIRTYRTVKGKTYYGPVTDISTYTKPGKVSVTKLTPLVCAFKAQWSHQKGSGYQMVVATDSKFRHIIKDTNYKHSRSSREVYYLDKSKTYYVKMRAYWRRDGKTVYGAWSNTKSVTTRPISAGWNNINGKKYYYYKGYALTGHQWIDGDPYYFSSSGVLRGSTSTMWDKIKNKSSSTNWIMCTDTTYNATCIYYGYAGNWTLKKYYRCSTGAWDTPTVKGTFYIGNRGYSFSDEDYTCWYWTSFYGSEYLYHSVPYVTDSKVYFRDSRIGYNISHGCVRLDINHAKWIYDNIPYGTKVIIF